MTEEKKLRLKNNLILFFLCLLFAFAVLLFCSRNSFLYAFNDWVDMNWYVTLGRSVAGGKVMYRDIYEQKGPVTYFVFAFFSLFGNAYYACFIFECVCMALFMYFAYKFLRHFLNKFNSYIGAAVVVALTCLSVYFVQGGGAVEEYFLPVIAYLVCRIYEYLSDPKERDLTKVESLVIGVLLALTFWTKFIVLFIPALLVLIWFVVNLTKKNFKRTFADVGLMFVGFFVITLPILLYFVANGAIRDLYACYFYDNIFRYDALNYNIFRVFVKNMFVGSWLTTLVGVLFSMYVVGTLIYFFVKDKNILIISIPAVAEFVTLLCMKMTQTYYSLVLMVFLAVLFLPILKLIEYILGRINKALVYKVVQGVLCSLVIAGLVVAAVVKADKQYVGDKLENYAAAVVIEDIESSEETDKSFYCFMMSDYGLYNLAGVIPDEKYYVKNNFVESAYPEMYASIVQAMESHKYNFIVTVLTSYNIYRARLEANNYKLYKQYGNEGESFVLLTRAD